MNILDFERTFCKEKELTYAFVEGKINKLLVIFSGYSMESKIKASYHYIRYTDDLDCHRLFILDNYGYDGRGCWYLGEDNNFFVEDLVVSLIETILMDYQMGKEDVILAGSSKGGFASLYIGLKYHYKYIITGAPQVYLYKYLKYMNFPLIIQSISGLAMDDDRNLYLDQLFSDLIPSKEQVIHFTIGKLDFLLETDVIPFLRSFPIDGCNVHLQIVEGNHNVIGDIYGNRLNQLTKQIINNEEISNEHSLSTARFKSLISPQYKATQDSFSQVKAFIQVQFHNEDTIKVLCAVPNVHLEYACYLKVNGKLTERWYQGNPVFYFEVNPKVNNWFQIEVFLRDASHGIVRRDYDVFFEDGIFRITPFVG